MARVLVTGGGGFLGKAMCDALLARNDEVIAFETGDCSRLERLAAREAGLTIVRGDMLDGEAVEQVMATYRPKAVVHCAAIVGVLASLQQPAQVFRVNIEGSINLFDAAARNGTRRIIHISTEEIYGAFTSDRIDEDHAQQPLHAYGISKAAVEHLGRSYRATHGIECINLRISWVYGPDFPRDRVPCNMVKAAIEGRPLHIPCGAISRIDHTYLDDAVAGVLGALDCPYHAEDAYHVASSTCPSLAEIAGIIAELVPGAEITVGPGSYRHAGEIAMPRKGALDCTRAREAFGYEPRFDIRTGLEAYLAHLRERTD